MIVTGVALTAAVIASVIAKGLGVNIICPAGQRVFSLTVWSGRWVDGLYMRCTGGGKYETIPKEFNEDPGGDNYDGICAGTAGVRSMGWDIPSAPDHHVMVYGNITCLNNETVFFADSDSYDQLAIDGSRSVSCEEGEYLRGLKYEIDNPEEGDFPYFLTSIGFMCSTAPLDPICTVCSGDTKLRNAEDQPRNCASPICTEAECCRPIKQHPEVRDVAITLGIELAIGFVVWLACAAFGCTLRVVANGNDAEGAGEDGQNLLPDGGVHGGQPRPGGEGVGVQVGQEDRPDDNVGG